MNTIISNTPEARVFTATKDNEKQVTVRVRRPSRREQESGDLEASRTYNQALMGGLPPRARILRKLREQELWTTADDEQLNELRTKVARLDNRIAELNTKLEAAGKPDQDGTAVVADLTPQRDALVLERAEAFKVLSQRRVEIDSMLAHTSEAKSEEAQRNHILACVAEVVNAGKPDQVKFVSRVWDSVDSLLSETDQNLLQRVVYEWMTFNAGLPSEWDKDTAAPADKPAEVNPVALEPVAIVDTNGVNDVNAGA